MVRPVSAQLAAYRAAREWRVVDVDVEPAGIAGDLPGECAAGVLINTDTGRICYVLAVKNIAPATPATDPIRIASCRSFVGTVHERREGSALGVHGAGVADGDRPDRHSPAATRCRSRLIVPPFVESPSIVCTSPGVERFV